ncbi:CTLH/CRA C-terminal to lish motif domain-containing protein [Gautieria morchelliformis]|nr:CTLH/CRA C-terminal to lish motif domain-containing protein [Gautieria morchelliformis]
MGEAEAASFASTPGDLRQIVLNYLCDNCYADTAQVLAGESSTRELDRDGDEVLTGGDSGVIDLQVLRVVQLRKEIKTRILSGRIDDATDMLNTHFPTVLAPMADEVQYDPALLPANLFLNLRIQNFIEQSRTRPLPWPSSSSSDPPTRTYSPSKDHLRLDEPYSSLSDSAEDEQRKNRLLCLMHELYTLARKLQVPEDRTTYLKELSNVGGLLVYPVPEMSPGLHKYLDISRREAVSDQINEAILCLIHQAYRSAYNPTILDPKFIEPPPTTPGQRPSGTEPFLREISTTRPKDVKDVKTIKEKDSPEKVVPLFELERLLGSDP